ncbi:hypothetical protein PMIN06_012029 [Paraphaeosphaeria minitans]
MIPHAIRPPVSMRWISFASVSLGSTPSVLAILDSSPDMLQRQDYYHMSLLPTMQLLFRFSTRLHYGRRGNIYLGLCIRDIINNCQLLEGSLLKHLSSPPSAL